MSMIVCLNSRERSSEEFRELFELASPDLMFNWMYRSNNIGNSEQDL